MLVLHASADSGMSLDWATVRWSASQEALLVTLVNKAQVLA